ncbi:hypothetical protein GMRT_15604 [Giardia muris]|uniref:Uncharacterized protein n=1 Tax=Giardia muris TaxID=5742 RepID=A0A4Z1SV45_GIAMU|nr:hypothetical protein GMRT_15604 [Giardia muris]|eukprot:TNJ28805.1 hypothetical protein GMRT_15604 [Giardia muris]
MHFESRDRTCLGCQQVYWSVWHGMEVPKTARDYAEAGDVARTVMEPTFLSEIRDENATLLSFLQKAETLIRLTRLVFGPSPHDLTLVTPLAEKIRQDRDIVAAARAEEEVADTVISLFAACESATNLIEHYLTEEMVEHLLYFTELPTMIHQDCSPAKAYRRLHRLAQILKSVCQNDERHTRLFSLFMNCNDALKRRLRAVALHSSIEDMVTFVTLRRVRNPDFEERFLSYLAQIQAVPQLVAILCDPYHDRLPLDCAFSSANYILKTLVSGTIALPRTILLDEALVQVTNCFTGRANLGILQLAQLGELYLAVVGLSISRVVKASLACKQHVITQLRLQALSDSTTVPGLDSVPTIDILPTALLEAAAEDALCTLDQEKDSKTILVLQEAKFADKYQEICHRHLSFLPQLAQRIRNLQEVLRGEGGQRGWRSHLLSLFTYARTVARLCSIPASVRAQVYEVERGCGPISEYNGLSLVSDGFLTLDGSQFADLAETGLAGIGGPSDISVEDTTFIDGRVFLSISGFDVIRAIKETEIPKLLLELSFQYREATVLHFYTFRVLKVLLAYSFCDETLVSRVFEDYGLIDVIRLVLLNGLDAADDSDDESQVPATQRRSTSLETYLKEYLRYSYRLALNISDFDLYASTKRYLSLRSHMHDEMAKPLPKSLDAVLSGLSAVAPDHLTALQQFLIESDVIRDVDTLFFADTTASLVFRDPQGDDPTASRRRLVADQSAIDALTASLMDL